MDNIPPSLSLSGVRSHILGGGPEQMRARGLATTDVGIDDGAISLSQILDALGEFEEASLGLVAWEYCVPESAVAVAWASAIRHGLIRAVGTCRQTGETMFALTS